MQADGAAHGRGTVPRSKRSKVLLNTVAVTVIAAMVTLLAWVTTLEKSGVGAQDATPNEAGSTVIHDDAGNVNR
jgi:hypothetical protein